MSQYASRFPHSAVWLEWIRFDKTKQTTQTKQNDLIKYSKNEKSTLPITTK